MDRLDKDLYCLWHGSSAEKTKLMTNNTDGISVDIRVSGEKLDEVDTFKYLGALVRDQDSKPEALSGMALTTAAPSKLKRTIWEARIPPLAQRPCATCLSRYSCIACVGTLEIDSGCPEEVASHGDEML